jgi:hypothetical protein
MSRNPYLPFSVSLNDSPEQIEVRIGLLIRLYLTDQHSIIAQAVVDHINAILAHSGFVKTIERRCLYLRLAAHWRCLAWIDNQADKGTDVNGTTLRN